MTDSTDPETAAKPASSPDPRMVRHVEDALELANFAVSTGAKSADGAEPSFEDIRQIQSTAAQLELISLTPAAGGLTLDDWDKFEQAYYRLASLMTPVTAETLRDTQQTGRPKGDYARFATRAWEFIWGYSPAQRFTREIWYVAFLFAVAIIVLESWNNYLGLQKDATEVASLRFVIQVLVPWAYGGLGACAFLLRSAHYFIYRRSFDTRRTPEYFNRILLGAISGGTITLFTEYLAGSEDGSAVHLGAAALGFVAGYSGDLLFKTVERIVTAIFPKDVVGDDSNRETPPSGPQPAPSNGGAAQNGGVQGQGAVQPGQGGAQPGQGGAQPVQGAAQPGQGTAQPVQDGGPPVQVPGQPKP